MKQQYVIKPAEVEVHAVGDKTDVILRKDIEQVEKTDMEEPYTVYECEEKQFRYPGALTKEEVEAAADTWWDYEGSGTGETPEPTIAERLAAIQAAQEAQDEVLAELLLNAVSDDSGLE